MPSFVGFSGAGPLTSLVITAQGEEGFDSIVNVDSAAPAISAAPEPSTWLLMFAGIGGIGLMLRRARKTMGFRFKDAFAA